MEGMRFQKQRASSDQRMVSPGQHIYDFLVEALAGQVSGRRTLASVPYGRRREVDADTMVSKTRKPVGVKPRTAAKIEYSARLVAKQGVMYPGHVRLDSLGASA